MHHDFFAWVRLVLLLILILTFALWCSITETQYQLEHPEPEEPIHITKTAPLAITHTEAVAAPEPTFRQPLVEITPAAKPDTSGTEPPTEPIYTTDELDMLALVIYQEAGADYCSDETRLMVGTVVMNRIADPRFPDTMYEVLTQEAQYGRFHWTGLVWPERASKEEEAHAVARAYAIAERILQGERVLPADVIFQSEYILGEIVAVSDGFYFCR